MTLANKELQNIYCGALYFEETEDGYLKANQYIYAGSFEQDALRI